MTRFAYILLCACIFASCKDSEVRTNYVLTPYIQLQDKGDQISTTDIKAYGYYGDTTNWKVASYEDALNGIITSKEDETQTRVADFAADPAANGELTLGPFTQYNFMILVCQTNPAAVSGGRMYAWRNAKTTDDLPQLSVHVTFRPWRTDRVKREGGWLFVNENPPTP